MGLHYRLEGNQATLQGIISESNKAFFFFFLIYFKQFKKDIDEHQSLAENVLQEGEILLQCLLDNTPGEMLEALNLASLSAAVQGPTYSLVRSR